MDSLREPFKLLNKHLFLNNTMPEPCQVSDSVIELIGCTPVTQIRNVLESPSASLWAKLESFNPGGSVKDRICLGMIEAAEKSGKLKPGMTIVEPTSGNTGIGLALVAAVKGYELILTMPDTMSEERRSLLAAYGAKIVLTPDSKGMHAAIEKAREISQNQNYFMPQQFNNPANPAAHRSETAKEILQQIGRIDALVLGVGTGGTITGVGDVLRKENPRLKIYAVEPSSSPVLKGKPAGYHNIQGIGAGFVPSVLDTSIYDEVIAITEEEAISCTRNLAKQEGLLVGISSGAACAAAIRVASKLAVEKTVLTIFCDTGERYLTTDIFQAEGI